MDNEDLLLMHSWASKAMQLFEEELNEVDRLNQAEEEALQAELEQAKKQAAEEAERVMGPTSGGGGSKKIPSSSKGGRHGADDSAFQNAKMTKILEERVHQLQEKSSQQKWRQLVSHHSDQLQRARTAAKPVLQWERKELEFFSSHNTDYYTMGDILAVDRPRPQDASAAESPQRPNSAPASPSRSSKPTTTTTTTESTVPSSSAPEYIIDAVKFAQHYNEALEKEYAYKVVLGSHDAPKSSSHSVEEANQLRDRLKDHKPGLDLAPDDFCVPQDHLGSVALRSKEATKKDFFLPSLTAGAAATYSGKPAALADGTKVAPLSSSLTLPFLKTQTGEATKKKASSASKRGRSLPPSAVSGAVKKDTLMTTKKKGSSTEGIECSHTVVDLSTCAGQTVQTVLRFTNRRSFRTRLRVHNATHPWLRYECSYIAPVAGSTNQANVPYETPLSSGGYIEVTVTFHPLNLSETEFEDVLQLGVCREINSRDGEGAEWAFLPIPIRCKTLSPSFQITEINKDGEQVGEQFGDNHQSIAFPYTLVLSSVTLRYRIENLGSTAIVNLLSDSKAFVLNTSPSEAVELRNGESMEVEVTFFPKDEGLWQGHLVVVVRDEEEGPVLAEHEFSLEGTAVVPQVSVLRIGGVELENTEYPQWRLDSGEDIPRHVVEQSTPGIQNQISVLVANDTPIELPFVWRSETALATPVTSAIHPSEGLLPPNSRTEFTVSLTPQDTQPLLMSWNLFLQGLPHLSDFSEEEKEEVPEEILDFYEVQDKLIPSASSAGDEKADGYADPFFVYQQSTRVLDTTECQDTYTTGFFIYVLPTAPQLVIAPSCLEETVECLIRFENVRRVTLQNRSPRSLHFFFDPTEEERPSQERGMPLHKDEVNVRCVPRTGVIPPFSDVRVNVHFTVLQVGPCSAVIDCYVPEIAESLGMAPNAGNLFLELKVTGVGPSVHTSTEYLDFGLVEMGKEVDASFTVTNDNPTPIEFDLQDPMMREPPRFVFIPPSFRLGPGDSVEVTVYRKGVSVEDEQTFFEVVVRDGATIAIETRATIQAATMVLDDAYLNFGEVPEGEWREASFYLSNLSALDIPFTIEPGAAPSPFIELEYASGSVLQAGQHHVPIKVKARFYCNPEAAHDANAYRTLLGLRSSRGNQILLVEVRCDSVQQLSVSCTVTSPAGAQLVKKSKTVVLESPFPVSSPLHGSKEVAAAPQEYDPVTVRATLGDSSPVTEQRLTLEMCNLTGCSTSYSFKATNFVEIYTIKESALEMIKKKKESSKAESGSKPHSQHNTHGSTVPPISTERPVFWASARSGAEAKELERREGLTLAQELLLDGRGCATSLISANSGPLQPNETLPLAFSLFSNLPGVYNELIQLQCGALPRLTIPVRLELKGKPLLLDPSTSGLTTEGRKQVLVMPSVIAPLSVSHRKLRLLNRVPRDVFVNVNSYLGTSTFVVVAVDDTVDASQVVLRLGTVSEQYLHMEEKQKGKTRVSPARFMLPACTTVEVLVEYSPAAAMVTELLSRIDRISNPKTEVREEGAEEEQEEEEVLDVSSSRSREVLWEGSLVITTEIAKTEFNDAFFIDEFYTKHADRFPSTRALVTTPAGPSVSQTSIAQHIQNLTLQQPLRTRPGRVVLKNRIIYPTESEKRKLQQADMKSEVDVQKASGYGPSSEESDDDDDRSSAPQMGAGESRSVEELMAELKERQELLDYIHQRREETVLESREFFLPVELRLRAQCGVPRLAVQPSPSGVFFPPYLAHQDHCSRTVRLTNRNRAALSFRLEVESTTNSFVIACTRLLPSKVEEDPLIDDEDDDEEKRRKAAKELKWSGLQTQLKAEKMLKRQIEAKEREKELKTTTVAYEHGTVFTLRCEDAVDVTVALSDGDLLQKAGALEAALVIHYPYADEPSVRPAQSTRSGASSSPSPYSLRSTTSKAHSTEPLSDANRLPVTQSIPLYASYKVAEVQVSPSLLWFRPGQTSHDGRAQPSYALSFTLSNCSVQEVEYTLQPISLQNLNVDFSSSATVGRPKELTLKRKVKEVVHLPDNIADDSGEGLLCIRDVTHPFHIEAITGTIPPSTMGGQPGLRKVRVQFKEHSNVRYECAYALLVNGDPTEEVIVLRGDSREVEI